MGIPINQLIKIRKEKLQKIIQLGFDPSPPSYQRQHLIKD
jgi:hypothetical protein